MLTKSSVPTAVWIPNCYSLPFNWCFSSLWRVEQVRRCTGSSSAERLLVSFGSLWGRRWDVAQLFCLGACHARGPLPLLPFVNGASFNLLILLFPTIKHSRKNFFFFFPCLWRENKPQKSLYILIEVGNFPIFWSGYNWQISFSHSLNWKTNISLGHNRRGKKKFSLINQF